MAECDDTRIHAVVVTQQSLTGKSACRVQPDQQAEARQQKNDSGGEPALKIHDNSPLLYYL